MKRGNIWITVAVTVVIVALLAAGGYALFRLGYARGVADAAGGLMMRGLEGRFGSQGMHPFANEMGPGWNHPDLYMYGMHSRSIGRFPAFGWLPGLLLLVGVIALVVIAVNGLTRRSERVNEAPMAPAEPEKPSARRRAKKEE